ncbi:hypothetical protein CDV31_016348 [Fusarium ambrosium]|uniref:Uncharacterized protein n=1 Tax=Fusarium ambrosium TaxID=131363 RepID=A0A428SAP3_9HYPO|nr:hypothetical protein CDV31_016348 [Fusarium ambrosium]
MAVKDVQLRHVPYSHFILPLLQYAILDYANSLDSETTGQDEMKAEGDIVSLTLRKWRRMKQGRNEEEVLPTIDILRQDSARFSETIRIQQRFSTLWLQHSDRSIMPTDTKLSQEHEAAMGKDRMAFILKCSGPSGDIAGPKGAIVNPKGVTVDIVPLWYYGKTPPRIDQTSVSLHTKISLRNPASLEVDQGGQLGMLAVFSKEPSSRTVPNVAA